MRATLLLVAVLAACGGHRGSSPAWPTRTVSEIDGGESISPRTAAVVASTETDDAEDAATVTKPVDAAKPDAAKAEATRPTDAKPAETVITAPEEVINVDDIVIEIED